MDTARATHEEATTKKVSLVIVCMAILAAVAGIVMLMMARDNEPAMVALGVMFTLGGIVGFIRGIGALDNVKTAANEYK